MAPRRVWAMASARRWSPAARGRGAVIFMCGPMSMCSWAMAPSAAPAPAIPGGWSPGPRAPAEPRAAAAAVPARTAARTRASEWRMGGVGILRSLLFMEHPPALRPAPHRGTTSAGARCGVGPRCLRRGDPGRWPGAAAAWPALQQPLAGHQLGVEHGGAGGAAQDVVRERDQLPVEDRALAHPAHGGG